MAMCNLLTIWCSQKSKEEVRNLGLGLWLVVNHRVALESLTLVLCRSIKLLTTEPNL